MVFGGGGGGDRSWSLPYSAQNATIAILQDTVGQNQVPGKHLERALSPLKSFTRQFGSSDRCQDAIHSLVILGSHHSQSLIKDMKSLFATMTQ